jgi:hypothetical protein
MEVTVWDVVSHSGEVLAGPAREKLKGWGYEKGIYPAWNGLPLPTASQAAWGTPLLQDPKPCPRFQHQNVTFNSNIGLFRSKTYKGVLQPKPEPMHSSQAGTVSG